MRRTWKSKPSNAYKSILKSADRAKRYRKKLRRMLEAGGIDANRVETVEVEHHLSHASSAYHLSGWDGAAIMTIDGKGEFTATMLAEGQGAEIEILREILNPDSLGLFYATLTEYLGFQANNGEFKVMGMSAYGDPGKVDVSPCVTFGDGSYRVNETYVWPVRSRRFHGKRFPPEMVALWGPMREGDGLAEPYTHIAAATQKALEDTVLHLIDAHLLPVLERHGGRLCLAGGCALNVRMNRKLLEHPAVNELYVQAASNDAGTALGAATFAARQKGIALPKMTHPYYGPEYDAAAVKAALERYKIVGDELSEEACIELAADLLAAGQVVAWHQGRMEHGPRALGNRSILGNPAHPGTADAINEKIKFRETWRPFCPSLLAERSEEIFGTPHPSPFMNLSFTVTEEWRKKIPEAVHVDGSARPQTVTREQNPKFYRLIQAFEERTGLPVLINTSLNRRGEPMCCSPDDTLACFYGSGLEHLFLGNVYVSKANKPPAAVQAELAAAR
jgi:carbamoyltransferase